MSDIDYRRHFALLILGVLVLSVLVPPAMEWLPAGAARFHAHFGLLGAMNATAWVLALRVPASIGRRLTFIIVAAALSIAVPYDGSALASFLHSTNNDVSFFSTWAAASAFGAATYWLVIRGFWLRGLAWSSLL